MTEPFKICKIIILYMLDKVDFPLTTSQFSDFILNEEYTNYFTLQQCISELVDSGFIRPEYAHAKTYYHLTDEGRESLGYFKDDISPEILLDVDAYLKDKQYELRDESSVKADFYETGDHEYDLRCQVLEKGVPIIDLTLKVPDEETAAAAADNWEDKNQELYALIMEKLLKK